MTSADEDAKRDGEVVVECEFDESPEKLWRALTTPELIAEWLETEPVEKRSEGAATGYEIVEAEPFTRVRYAWHDSTSPEPVSLVTFELRRRPDGGTWFRLTHGPVLVSKATVAVANKNSPPLALAA